MKIRRSFQWKLIYHRPLQNNRGLIIKYHIEEIQLLTYIHALIRPRCFSFSFCQFLPNQIQFLAKIKPPKDHAADCRSAMNGFTKYYFLDQNLPDKFPKFGQGIRQNCIHLVTIQIYR